MAGVKIIFVVVLQISWLLAAAAAEVTTVNSEIEMETTPASVILEKLKESIQSSTTEKSESVPEKVEVKVTEAPSNRSEDASKAIRNQDQEDLDVISQNAIPYGASKQFQLKDLTDDLATWEAPRYIQKSIPYYLAGHDNDDQPIWVLEYGHMDLRSVLERGPEAADFLEKYIKQFAYRMVKSIREKNETGEVNEAVFIMDFEGLSLRQLAYVPSVRFLIRLANAFRDLVLKYTGTMLVINTNFVAENLINLVRPIFGDLLAKVEVHGTNKAKWVPVVRRTYGPENIPEWYGGSNKSYKPLAVYG